MKPYKILCHFLFLLLFFSLGSCAILTPESPPYIITKPVCLIENKPGSYPNMGVEFTFTNTSSKTITSFSVSFMVYDAETELNPFVGQNTIRASLSGMIPAQSMKECSFSLDEYVYVVPDEPYLIDFFYISEINYDDGSQWTDTFGVYYTRSY